MTEEEKRSDAISQFFSKILPIVGAAQSKGLLLDAEVNIVLRALIRANLLTNEQLTEELKNELNTTEETILSGQAKPLSDPDGKLNDMFGRLKNN